MRKLLIAGWLMLPVGAWAYHEGPGQDGLQLDATDGELAKARAAADSGDWAAAVTHYEAAYKELPDLDTPERLRAARRIKLSAAKAKLEASQLIEARDELKTLIAEFSEARSSEGTDATDDVSALLSEAKEAHANAQYYYTWLMRLEGYPREEWEPEIEVARQSYRLLAEEADERGNSEQAMEHMEDLEAAIKLARLDLEELQGLPLPSQ